MTLDEYTAEYGGMKAAEVRSLIASSPAFRAETERIYYSIYRKRLNRSCGDCWLDAYILIMRGDRERQKKMMNKRYDLRAGAVLVDPKDPTKNATTHNITDELAIHHLRIHPTCKRLFSVLPENWEEEVYGKAEDDSDLEGMSAEEKAVFEGYSRAERDRISEIMAEANTPEEALEKLAVLEEEGYRNASLRLRPDIDKAIAEKEAERLAKEKAAAEAAANAGAPADESKADAPADAPAEEEKAADGKENKKSNTKK